MKPHCFPRSGQRLYKHFSSEMPFTEMALCNPRWSGCIINSVITCFSFKKLFLIILEGCHLGKILFKYLFNLKDFMDIIFTSISLTLIENGLFCSVLVFWFRSCVQEIYASATYEPYNINRINWWWYTVIYYL